MDSLRFQAGGRRRRPNLGLVCFVLMLAVFLVKDACLGGCAPLGREAASPSNTVWPRPTLQTDRQDNGPIA